MAPVQYAGDNTNHDGQAALACFEEETIKNRTSLTNNSRFHFLIGINSAWVRKLLYQQQEYTLVFRLYGKAHH